jgi:glutathione-independent formaldehyde dehydrogenase
MKAVVYSGPRDVTVKDVPNPTIERPTDVIVKIRATNICGSDLHMYEGRTDMEPGRVLGHENLGQVMAVGDAVERLKVDDWVCLPFNISCGHCRNCEKGFTAYCLRANPTPGFAGAAYGFAGMGPYNGGQAELLRVPWADFNCLKLPPDAEEKQNDYVMVADIFPTGWHCTELAGMKQGDAVAIYGAGPVGLMAALSAMIKGACKVMVVDHYPDRLNGQIVFDWGLSWTKGQHIGTGQCNVKAYNRQLRDLIHVGRAKPSFIVSHELELSKAPEGYQHFDARDPGWTKVVLKPA